MKLLTKSLQKRNPADMIRQRLAGQQALAFVGPADDPLEGMPDDLPPEQRFAETIKRLEGGLSAAMKKQSKDFIQQGRSDYYCVLCFEQGEQVGAFLKGLGYPAPDDMFVDGPLLARILNIEIPQPTYRLKPLRKPDKALARLVTRIPTGI